MMQSWALIFILMVALTPQLAYGQQQITSGDEAMYFVKEIGINGENEWYYDPSMEDVK